MGFVIGSNLAYVRGDAHGKFQGHFGHALVSDRAKLACPLLVAQRGNKILPYGLSLHRTYAPSEVIFGPPVEPGKCHLLEGTFRGSEGFYHCYEHLDKKQVSR